ncbi:CHAT domain-containing protein [Anabaena sp. UHCC 0399]|uniref:CHAT domain-containing protein n=1 Tax=Anabaena sp. UHCC 0399 TaxID=3110238 RepID=UPI002B204C14|nr:CHAT domain-containing protein [Anabaena sp. UHCC 0399]MEA5565368.1 CHAT domain-containing protein [Anabaena sp. UHCC 0399]
MKKISRRKSYKYLNKKEFSSFLKIKINTIGLFYICFTLSLLLTINNIPAVANQSIISDANKENQQLSNPSDLLQQGKKYYQAGQYTESSRIWENVLKIYQSKRELINQAQVLNYLALAYKDLGKIPQAQTAIAESINISKSLKNLDAKSTLLLAQALNTQGMLQILQGQTDTAIDTWKQAAKTYERTGDKTGKLISQINQAQGLQASGQYYRAKTLLEELVKELQNQPDNLLKAQGLRSLGIAMQTVGDLKQSKIILDKSWEISKQFNSLTDISAVLFSIGNVAQDLQEDDIAWTYYQEAIKLSPEPQIKLEAQLNQLSLLVKLQNWELAQTLIPEIETNLAQLPPSRPAIYAKINFTESLINLEASGKSKKAVSDTNTIKIAQLLATAIQQAKDIKDPRAEAYSINQLGKLYQKNDQLADAAMLTQQALTIAQEINATDLVARAAGQLGIVAQQQGDNNSAIAAYDIAFNNLQSLRSDLVAINRDVQFNFKETIEPIYRDYVSLLLQKDNQSNLKQALQVMEALQIAELDNFFRDACLDNNNPVVLEKIDLHAAVLYPIILSDRLEVILSVPNQPLRHYSTLLSKQQVETTLKQLYSSLSPGYPNDERLRVSQEVYNWLVAPAQATLTKSNIKTLVFVPDSLLRNLPMGVLYDGKKYLIENYSVALSPGLKLFPQGLQRQKLSVLAAGLTEARQGFNPLPGVTGEIKQVTTEANSQVLLDNNFTRDTLKAAIANKSFPIVHLATHGQFSSNPEETFLLTWGDRISIQDFDNLFKNRRQKNLEPIELLVMSACQTAVGDNRATLGLAGFALRSGAKSTIASLWSVSDESTSSLMKEFYAELSNPKLNKAEALQQAQIKIMANPLYKHPYFWSSFVLVGNWL